MLELEAAGLKAQILPAIGGIVARLDWYDPKGRSHSVLRPPPRAPSTSEPNHGGTWAMLPFANRAFSGVIDDGMQRFSVPANDPGGAIHGFGWQSAWDVLRYDRGHTRLEHRRVAGPDPYRYRAWQEIALSEAGMTIAFGVTNEADRALPYGIGHHPWFPCALDTELTLCAEGALVFGEAFRAKGRQPLADGGPYSSGTRFQTQAVTAWNFLGWDGRARIETRSTGLAIDLTASGNLDCPVVWAPAGADFLCVEPQSHASGAPSEAAAREAGPLKRLEPGETLEGWMTIKPAAL